ncbi:MAG TPA: hypothetical protein VFI06_04730 [Chitinophagaceae bacterium]|nr:hypothetical protein [Chitinophagaceae bacterium]
MQFQKEDLEGTFYDWSDDKQDLFTGRPSRRSFDRFNGNQVLFLINFYGSLSENFTLQEGKSLERRIQYELPIEAKSEISVFNWIRTKVTP